MNLQAGQELNISMTILKMEILISMITGIVQTKNIETKYATKASNAWLDYGFNEMKIEIMNAYTNSENGASNHVLQKFGMNFMEDYLDKDGIFWRWWQLENPNL